MTQFLFLYLHIVFFFFQAEDGIRDLVRSRGLGDVYKRQITNLFVKKGELVVSTKGKTPDRNKSYKTFVQPVDTEIPIVVLVNAFSLSLIHI